MNDEYHLSRFVAAQAAVYDDAVHILRRGRMCSPYMDFIFPRFRGAGYDATVDHFAIRSLDEARAYLDFPLLGPRYRECVEALSWLEAPTAAEVFGEIDTRKLHSSLTLFAEATNEPLMRIKLEIWFENLADEDTLSQLDRVP